MFINIMTRQAPPFTTSIIRQEYQSPAVRLGIGRVFCCSFLLILFSNATYCDIIILS